MAVKKSVISTKLNESIIGIFQRILQGSVLFAAFMTKTTLGTRLDRHIEWEIASSSPGTLAPSNGTLDPFRDFPFGFLHSFYMLPNQMGFPSSGKQPKSHSSHFSNISYRHLER